MQNGDLIFYQSWYQEAVIVPFPSDTSNFYLFSVGVTSNFGLYYSIIDKSLDSGRGSVTVKNVQLQNYQASDGIMAVKHGNGRDWWVVSRRWNTVNDEFYEYLISPAGISGPFVLHSGSFSNSGWFWTSVSKSGNKFVWFNLQGLIELYDFDRCTGGITLNSTITPEATSTPYPYYLGAEFSPNEQYLYISKYDDSIPLYPSHLIQFDLAAGNILASADTIWNYDSTQVAAGKLKLAPDGKIYFACIWSDGTFPYPYQDTTFNTVNNNLSVINYPDSAGVTCGFAPFSFNLGVGRCYVGLPNNPDYELGAVVNSMCDTVLQVDNRQYTIDNSELHVFYHAGWQVAFINAEGLRGKNYSLAVYDLTGREVFKEEGVLHGYYFTKDLRCEEFANGMYVVRLQTEKEVLSKKFIKE